MLCSSYSNHLSIFPYHHHRSLTEGDEATTTSTALVKEGILFHRGCVVAVSRQLYLHERISI